jgi:hypothetical protein
MHTTRAHARTHKHTNTQHTHTHTCETEGRGNTLERARGDVGAKMRRRAVSCRIHRKALCQPRGHSGHMRVVCGHLSQGRTQVF